MEVNKTNREQLHPGQPLKIRGIAQGANDFLAKTPALRGGPTEVELVASQDAHQRRLAMYEGGTRFNTAPRSSPRMTASDPGIPDSVRDPGEPDSGPPTEDQKNEAPSRFLLPAAFIGLLLFTLKKVLS